MMQIRDLEHQSGLWTAVIVIGDRQADVRCDRYHDNYRWRYTDNEHVSWWINRALAKCRKKAVIANRFTPVVCPDHHRIPVAIQISRPRRLERHLGIGAFIGCGLSGTLLFGPIGGITFAASFVSLYSIAYLIRRIT